MKLLAAYLLLFCLQTSFSQGFYASFLLKGGDSSWQDQSGKIYSINDSLGCIILRGSNLWENAFFGCTYEFIEDTLIMREIDHLIVLSQSIEYYTEENYLPSDSLYINFQEYNQGSGAWILYDSLTLEVNDEHFENKGLFKQGSLCDSYCNYVRRPKTSNFNINIWDGVKKLESFSVILPEHCHAVRLTRKLFQSGGSSFLSYSVHPMIPTQINIDGKSYILKTILKPTANYPFTFDSTLPSKPKQP